MITQMVGRTENPDGRWAHVTIENLNEWERFDGRGYVNPELKDMFVALGLIESFGSGVRRAKYAMCDSGLPALVYEPANDADDYTMVTAPIQPEFLENGGAEAPGDKRPTAGAPSNGPSSTPLSTALATFASGSSEPIPEASVGFRLTSLAACSPLPG